VAVTIKLDGEKVLHGVIENHERRVRCINHLIGYGQSPLPFERPNLLRRMEMPAGLVEQRSKTMASRNSALRVSGVNCRNNHILY
jgi:hypothetical protein